MSDKLDRFTKRARRVLTLAQEEALHEPSARRGQNICYWDLYVKKMVWQSKYYVSWVSNRAR